MNLYDNPILIQKIKKILHFLHFIPLIRGNQNYFNITIFIYMGILFIILILFLIMVIKLKSKNNHIMWPIYILKYALPIVFITFFGQTFLLIISFYGSKGQNSYYESQSNFNILFILSFIPLIIQIFFGLMTVLMYFEPDFYINNHDSILRKRNTFSDIVFLLCKMIIVLIFLFDEENESEQFGILIILSFITFLNAYCNLFKQHYSNKIIERFNNLLSLALFLSFFTLLIKKIFISLGFNGEIYLFILNIILMAIYYAYYTRNSIKFINTNFFQLNSGINCLNYIKQYLKIVEEKEVSRDSLLIFNSYIEKTEENCTNKNCLIKKYLKSLSKGNVSKFLLLQYAEKLYKIAISKFSNDIVLKTHYIIFLYTKINKQNKAKKELFSIKTFSFIDNIYLLICKRYLENLSPINNLGEEEKLQKINIIENLEYKNYSNQFKNLIIKSSSLYFDFWSSLYNYHIQGIENFSYLNDIGNQINKLIQNIEEIFKNLNKIKNNDYELIKLYEHFSKYILNNKEKYKQYQYLLNNLIINKHQKLKEIDYSNFDLNILNENDQNNYLIISMNKNNLGKIQNISLSACAIFGYNKNEIVGKNLNILIPDLFQENHEKAIIELNEKLENDFYGSLINNLLYNPKIIEFFVFGKNKSKYLIPLYLKIYLVQTEDSELVYIAEINRNNSFIGEIDDKFFSQDMNENICCILTDKHLVIQSFTLNCIDLLKLKSNIINSNYAITSFIKLNEDSMIDNSITEEKILENESEILGNESPKHLNSKKTEKSLENKLESIIKSKFLYPNKIKWKLEYNIDLTILEKRRRDYKNSSLISKKIIFDKIINNSDSYENNFLMQVKEAYILNKHVGYYFFLKKLNYSIGKEKNNLSSIFQKSKTKLNIDSLSLKNFGEENFHEKTNIKPNSKDYLKSGLEARMKYQLKDKYNSTLDINMIKLKRSHTRAINNFIRNEEMEKKINIINYNPLYIPKCKFNFVFDLNSLSYIPSTEINPFSQLKEKLKSQALNIMNAIKSYKKDESKNNSNSFNSKSSFYDEDNSSIEYSNDSFYSSSERNTSSIKSTIKKEKELNLVSNKKDTFNFEENSKEKNINEQYYTINTKNIKYMIYDFNKEMLVSQNTEKKSKMEILMNELKSEKNNFNYFPIYYKEKKSRNENEKNKKSIIIKNNTDTEKEKYFENEIKNALNKKENQKEISLFYMVLIFGFIIFLLINILEIIYVINSYLKLSKNISIIINIVNLKYYNNYIIFYLRELLLINLNYNLKDSNYMNYPSNKNKSDYQEELVSVLNKSFCESHYNLEKIYSSDLSISENATYMIEKKSYYFETKSNEYNFINVTSTLSAVIIEFYSLLSNILSSNDFKIESTQLYDFLRNSLNSLGNGYNLLIEIFLSELSKNESSIIKIIIVIIFINLLMYLIIYFIFVKAYSLIINKKNSYLDGFYGIELPLIKLFIKRSEIFLSKINEKNEFININDDEESYSSFSLSSKSKNEIFENSDKNEVNTKIIAKNSIKPHIFFILYILFSFIFLEFNIILFIFDNQKFMFNGNYIFHLQNYHTNILYLFNTYREFLFDQNSKIFDIPSYEYLIKIEDVFHSTCTKDMEILSVNNGYIKNIYKNYLKLNENGFCNKPIIEYFSDKEECLNFIGGKNGIIKFGIHFLIHDFIEDIRVKQNYIKLLIDKNLIIGNLTDNNKEYYENFTFTLTDEYFEREENKDLIFRMKLFNMEEIHFRLNTIYIHIILPYIDEVRKIIFNSVQKNFDTGHYLYIILVGIHILIILLINSFWLLPKANEINNEIYKVKNILSIIPIQILSSVPNINKLLNISKSSNSQSLNDFNI